MRDSVSEAIAPATTTTQAQGPATTLPTTSAPTPAIAQPTAPATTAPDWEAASRLVQRQHPCGSSFVDLSDPYGWEECLVGLGMLNRDAPVCGRNSEMANRFLLDMWADLDVSLRAPTVECVVSRCGPMCVTNHTAGVWLANEGHIELQEDSLMVLLHEASHALLHEISAVADHGQEFRCLAVSFYAHYDLIDVDEAARIIGPDCGKLS